jgi:microcystin degradation protein MlrC
MRLPFLIALNAQCTDLEPAAAIFKTLNDMAGRLKLQLEFTPGFPAADIAECGPVVWAHGADALATQSAVMALAREITRRRHAWQLQALEPIAAVALAIEQAARLDKPVLLADTQDNPGAGGEANTTGLIHALLKAGAGLRYPLRVAAGLMFDPAAAQAACKAGAGATINVSLGASVRTFTGRQSEPPITGPFTVRNISDGNATRVGPMGHGSPIVAGPSACLEKDGVLFAVASVKTQALDRSLFTMVGIDPAQMKIIILKSSVHFRADFAPIASGIHVVKAAGPVACDPKDLTWQKLPAAMLQ